MELGIKEITAGNPPVGNEVFGILKSLAIFKHRRAERSQQAQRRKTGSGTKRKLNWTNLKVARHHLENVFAKLWRTTVKMERQLGPQATLTILVIDCTYFIIFYKMLILIPQPAPKTISFERFLHFPCEKE